MLEHEGATKRGVSSTWRTGCWKGAGEVEYPSSNWPPPLRAEERRTGVDGAHAKAGTQGRDGAEERHRGERRKSGGCDVENDENGVTGGERASERAREPAGGRCSQAQAGVGGSSWPVGCTVFGRVRLGEKPTVGEGRAGSGPVVGICRSSGTGQLTRAYISAMVEKGRRGVDQLDGGHFSVEGVRRWVGWGA